MKVNTILKRIPASISIKAKNFKHVRRTSDVNQSHKDPFQNRQLLDDYGESSTPMIPIDSRANSKQPSSLERKPRPVNYRSMESLPSQPRDKENNNSFNNEYNDYNMPNDRYKKPFTYQPRTLNDGKCYNLINRI